MRDHRLSRHPDQIRQRSFNRDGSAMSDTPQTLYQLFMAYRTNLGYGTVAAILAVLRLMHEQKPLRTWTFEAAVCAALAGGTDEILSAFGLPSKWGYLTAVFIGVFGWRVVTNALKQRLTPSKPVQ